MTGLLSLADAHALAVDVLTVAGVARANAEAVARALVAAMPGQPAMPGSGHDPGVRS